MTTTMNNTYFETYDLRHVITLFPPEVIYPFSWTSLYDGQMLYCLGGGKLSADRDLCKEELRVWENGGYSITYWAHPWTPVRHNDENLAVVEQEKNSS